MSVLNDMLDDYFSYGISSDDDEEINGQDFIHKEYENEALDRYYGRTYEQKRYEDEINLFR